MLLSTWFAELNARWKAIAAIAAIFGTGLTAGAVAGGFNKLPDRVSALEQRADTLATQLSALQRDVTAIRKANQQNLCLTIAERAHSDWRKCVE